jgi:hypothetical protein
MKEMWNKHEEQHIMEMGSCYPYFVGCDQNWNGSNEAGCVRIFRKRITHHRFRWKKQRRERRQEKSSKQVENM